MERKLTLWLIAFSWAFLTWMAPAFAASDRAVAVAPGITTIIGDLNEELDQLFDVSSHPLDTVAGTNDVTASVADMPALTSLVNGMKFTITPANTNTGPVDLALDGLPEKDVVTPGGAQLGAGEWLAGTRYLIEYLGGASDHYRLLTQASGTAGALAVNIQTFTASGTYTPTAGIEHAIVVCTGGGGGGGGADTGGAAWIPAGAGGGAAGGTAIEEYSAATIGASQTVTIGAGGAAGSTTGGSGGTGGDTTFGTLMSATGGAGGTGTGTLSGTAGADFAGGTGGVPTGGDINITGGNGGKGWGFGLDGNADGAANNIVMAQGGAGGVSHWGGGAGANVEVSEGSTTDLTAAGTAGTAYGSGGSGAVDLTSTTGVAGGAGKDGVCIVYEYI
jgi:hypothetical protein